MNKVIEAKVDFYTILNKDNKILGFNYLDENNTKELVTFMQSNCFTIDMKELEMLEQKYLLTKDWQLLHNFSIILLTGFAIIFSTIELFSWFFN